RGSPRLRGAAPRAAGEALALAHGPARPGGFGPGGVAAVGLSSPSCTFSKRSGQSRAMRGEGVGGPAGTGRITTRFLPTSRPRPAPPALSGYTRPRPGAAPAVAARPPEASRAHCLLADFLRASTGLSSRLGPGGRPLHDDEHGARRPDLALGVR